MSGPREQGVLAQFVDVPALLAAVAVLRKRGYTRLQVYTPVPIEGMAQALGLRRSRLPLAMLVSGVLGAGVTLGMQYYAAVIGYPIDAGGRPDASWPAFVPAAIEMAILWAVIAGVVGMLLGNGLPRLHHPLFDVARFEAASTDGLFVFIEASDPAYDAVRVRDDLVAAGGQDIVEVSS